MRRSWDCIRSYVGNNMEKILYIAVSSQTGGAPRHILDALKNARECGYEIYVAVPNDGDYYPWFEEYAAGMLNVSLKPYSIRSLLALRRYVREHGIRLVHSHGKGAGMYARPLKVLCPGIRVVHTFHGVHVEQYGSLTRIFYCLIERGLKVFTDRFICVSQGEQGEALRLGFAVKKRTRVIGNGIDPEVYANVSVDRSRYLKEFGFPQDAYVIGCVARLEQIKGIGYLLGAMEELVKKYPQCRLLLVGDGPDREKTESQIRKAGLGDAVRIAGFRYDVPQLLKVFDVFASASLKEGLPYTLMEALASGTPVVATDVTGNRDVITDHQTGLLVEPKAADAIYIGLCYAKEHQQECQRWAENGKRLARESFTIQKSWENLVQVYSQVIF